MLSTDASRFFGEANDDLSCLVDRRFDGFALLRTESRQHVVGRVHVAWRPANANTQATKRARAQARHDVAQAVVAAVAGTLATVPFADLAQRQVEILVDDEQAPR